MSNRPTPAQAMALYHSLDRPSSREVAARFTAAGRPISAKSITRWKKQRWQGVPKATRAIAKIAAAVPALTGDPMSTLSDILTGNHVVPGERRDDESDNDKRRNDACSNAERAEQVMLRTLRTATVVNVAIHDIAAAVPEAGTVPEDAPLRAVTVIRGRRDSANDTSHAFRIVFQDDRSEIFFATLD